MLTDRQISDAAREAQIAFCLDKCASFVGAFARLIEREVEAGASGAAQDAKDAARYRWIRDGSEWEMFADRWLTKHDIYGGGPNDMDAAIDEAVEAQQRGSGT